MHNNSYEEQYTTFISGYISKYLLHDLTRFNIGFLIYRFFKIQHCVDMCSYLLIFLSASSEIPSFGEIMRKSKYYFINRIGLKLNAIEIHWLSVLWIPMFHFYHAHGWILFNDISAHFRPFSVLSCKLMNYICAQFV